MRGQTKPVQDQLWGPRVPDTSRHRLLQRIAFLLDLTEAVRFAENRFSAIGRPSIPVEQMLKAMLIGYLFGISSDRRLVEECADSLAFRSFLGLDFDDQMFTHASFTHWRQRLGPDFFRHFLHNLVGQCQGHGMRLGRVRAVDATTIKGQASLDGPLVSLPREADLDQYLQEAFAADEPVLPEADDNIPINLHDPDARLQRKGQEPADFAYQGSFSADPESGLIADATATPTEQPATMVDHVDHDPGLVRELVADSRYDDGLSLGQLQERGVRPYVPRAKRDRAGQFSKDKFAYDAAQDCYICPQGCRLERTTSDFKDRRHRYLARRSDCAACPLKGECTRGQRRHVDRHLAEAARERTVRAGPRYKQLMRRRRVAEHLFMLGKRDHNLRRARSLGLAGVQIQVALTAAAINLKKLVRFRYGPNPAVAVAQALRAPLFARLSRRRPQRRPLGACCDLWRPLTQEPSLAPSHELRPAIAAF
jgi:transposase